MSTTTALPGGSAPLAASDISSPDLGVDVSSDPFSSLERTSTLSEVMGGGGVNIHHTRQQST